MSLELLFGLSLQVLASGLVLWKCRAQWLSHSGAIFVLVSSVYYGAWEVVQLMFPGRNSYRELVAQEFVDEWTVIVGLALVVFAFFYCAGSERSKDPVYDAEGLSSWARISLPDWRLMMLLAVPGFWVTVSGQQFGYWINSLSLYMTGLALLTGSTVMVANSGSGSLLPVLFVQVVLLALLGARSGVVVNAALLLSIVMRLGVPIRWRRMLVPGVVAAVLMVLISVARVTGGRFTDADEVGITARIRWLIQGVPGLVDPNILGASVADDFIYRFDGNAFNAMVHRELARGTPPAGFQSLRNNLVLQVPSALLPGKLDRGLEELFEEEYTVAHYGLPDGIDYIAGTPGIVYSYGGAWVLWGIMAVLGLAYSRLDLWCARSASTLAYFVHIGLIGTAITLEGAVQGYFGTFRNLAIFYVFCLAVNWVSKWRDRGVRVGRARLRRSAVAVWNRLPAR